MLPLAAFAGPITPLDPCPGFQRDSNQLKNDLASTISSLATVAAQIGASDNSREFVNSQELVVLNGVNDAQNELVNSNSGTGAAQYVNSLCAYTMVKNELIWRFCSL